MERSNEMTEIVEAGGVANVCHRHSRAQEISRTVKSPVHQVFVWRHSN